MNIYALELAKIPNVSFKVMLRLAKTLTRYELAQTNTVIDEARDELKQLIESLVAVLVARLIANNPQLSASEAEFDWAVDWLWMWLRRKLEDEQAYAHRGLDALTPELAEQIDLAGLRERAATAKRLLERLFGGMSMVEIVKTTYIEQAENMASILGLIEQEGLGDELEEIVGPQLFETIKVCQVRYEAMVDDRLNRQKGLLFNLNEHRTELRWALVAYINAVQSLYRPKKPETAEVVLEALRPLINLRESLARTGSEVATEAELDEELAPIELPDMVPEGQEGEQTEQG